MLAASFFVIFSVACNDKFIYKSLKNGTDKAGKLAFHMSPKLKCQFCYLILTFTEN